MAFVKPSPNSSTSWRTRRYRETLAAKEEDKLWEIIETFIDSGVMKPRSQLRFFKAIEQFTKAVHIERVRWKQMKESKLQPQIDIVVQEAYKRYDITINELLRGFKNPSSKPNLMKARKFVATTLVYEVGLTRKRSAIMLGTSTHRFVQWLNLDVNID